MTTEYGIFNDEGCVERQFYRHSDAETAIAENYDRDDNLRIEEMCPDHADDEQPRDGCELCAEEEEQEEDA